MNVRTRHYLLQALGLSLLLLCWQWLSGVLSPMILATPLQTVMRLAQLLLTNDFWQVLLVTLVRLAGALSIACLIGFVLGVCAGRRPWLKHFVEPLRWLLMSVPPVVVVLLAMLWLGMGSSMVIFITVLLLSPTIYINTYKGIEQIDRHWLDLATIYKFSTVQRVINIYVPAIAAQLCATMVVVCCSGVRIIVLAEVLGAHKGLGYELANARGNFDTNELYAWVLVSLLLVAILEFLLLRPIQNKLLRWKNATN